ncbi:helix-turn-helix domain-containing protein [Telmatospirillum sp.]|uniref:winged helix-turn-helix transcriptional regulator n=1 Tax=Telmatospirillum sp. TaxID=2079197 RepID=UPI0028496390|nr:helix-turn-helix domain-containing protein [Telmatospirillum sp.]MDR3435338.1 helix-turn-helix domain-containing protein [Telmatospirillum sp.]
MAEKTYCCGLEAALDVIGGKWKVMVLWALHPRPHRFGELRRAIPGISEKMLIQNLKEMEADGIVTRQDFKEIPPRVEYAVTSFGRSLCEALSPLCEWGQSHMARIETCKESRDKVRAEKATDTDVENLQN